MYSLKELRARKNWTQAETAEKLKISVQSYNAWESDFGKVKARDGRRIANLFDVKIEEFFLMISMKIIQVSISCQTS